MIIGRRVNGSIVGAYNPPTLSKSSGIWSVVEIMIARIGNVWPSA